LQGSFEGKFGDYETNLREVAGGLSTDVYSVFGGEVGDGRVGDRRLLESSV